MLTEDLKNEIEKQFDKTPDDVISVSFGFKYKNNKKTNDKSIIFTVLEKKSPSAINPDEIIPKTIVVEGREYLTDVVQSTKGKLFTCFASQTDPNIQMLRGNPNLLAPMRGGNEIIMFPDDWDGSNINNATYASGTLGFFAVDNYDDRVVGVTNSHVAIYNRLFVNERNINEELPEPYNIIDDRPWTNIQTTTEFPPSNLVKNGNDFVNAIKYIKRYMPITQIGRNYVDCALLIMNDENVPSSATPYIDSTSYQLWQPIGEPAYTTHMPFATKQELDNLLTSNPNLYSTGRTTGPKGWGPSSSCILKVSEIGVSATIASQQGDEYWSDCIKFEYQDNSLYPARPGDSGSVVVADFGGVRKIVGLLFAGSETERWGLFCRIDRVAETLDIRAWDASYVLKKDIPTRYEIVATDQANLGGTPNFTHEGIHYWQAGLRIITTPDSYTPAPPSPVPWKTPVPAPTPTPTPSSGTGGLWSPNDNLNEICFFPAVNTSSSDCINILPLLGTFEYTNAYGACSKTYLGWKQELLHIYVQSQGVSLNNINLQAPDNLGTHCGINLRPTPKDRYSFPVSNIPTYYFFQPMKISFRSYDPRNVALFGGRAVATNNVKMVFLSQDSSPKNGIEITIKDGASYQKARLIIVGGCTSNWSVSDNKLIFNGGQEQSAVIVQISYNKFYSDISLNTTFGFNLSFGINLFICRESVMDNIDFSNTDIFGFGMALSESEDNPIASQKNLLQNQELISIEQPKSKQKLLPSESLVRTKLCQYASKTPLQVIDSFHGKTSIRKCDIYGFCSHSVKIPDRPEVYCCQECPNYFSNEDTPEELLIFTEKNREETIKVMNINNNPTPDQNLFQEVKYKKIEDFLKEKGGNTTEIEYKDLTEVSEQNLKDMNGMKVKPIDNIKPNVDELLGE